MSAFKLWVARRSVLECLLLGLVVAPGVHAMLFAAAVTSLGLPNPLGGMPQVFGVLCGGYAIFLPWSLLFVRHVMRMNEVLSTDHVRDPA